MEARGGASLVFLPSAQGVIGCLPEESMEKEEATGFANCSQTITSSSYIAICLEENSQVRCQLIKS